MGNHHSTAPANFKPRKNVHWKSAGRPSIPRKPVIIPILNDDEPNAITLRWTAGAHDGGAPLLGYQVECNRLGSNDWIRTSPPVVQHPELVLTGLEPPHRYQFRVAAINAVGTSDYSELSDILTVGAERHHDPPVFLQHLDDVTALENEKTEFRVSFTGLPIPTIAWFKDDYEIFSSRRTAIATTESSSVLIFHQTLPSDEGEIKCTATNRAGHSVTKAKLSLEAAPKLRYPRQYEDGLLYEINETIYIKTVVVGKPAPIIEWRHDGLIIVPNERIEITNASKFSMLKIHSARRSDRGEYQIHAKNSIGEDTAAFLVTVTAPPDPPRYVSVARQVDKSVTLNWEPPDDDGGCRIGNYIIEYYRTGWNVWLKATTSRKTSVTLFDLIEGSEYRFRVKAESPYGMSAPSADSASVKIPGRPVDMEFLQIESQIISQVLTREDGEEPRVSAAPRMKRSNTAPSEPSSEAKKQHLESNNNHGGSNEFMLVLYPDSHNSEDKASKRKSFQLDLEEALSPPPISLSAPEISTRCASLPFRALRNAVSSTELLHERAMERFYTVVAMKEEKSKQAKYKQNHIPYNKNEDPLTSVNFGQEINNKRDIDTRQSSLNKTPQNASTDSDQIYRQKKTIKPLAIVGKSNNMEDTKFNNNSNSVGFTCEPTREGTKQWLSMSFDEDYTASTASSEGGYSDDGSINEDIKRYAQHLRDEDIYNPRDKTFRPSPIKEPAENEEKSRSEIVKHISLPDPNFIPKPILKKRETKLENTHNIDEKAPLLTEEQHVEEKPKKEKMTILKRITKMPVQKPFPFPKLLSKKETTKIAEQLEENKKPEVIKKEEIKRDSITDEGRTVIEYYGNIVKEYGSNRKPAAPLYLNTEDLKTVAEKQEMEIRQDQTQNAVVKKKPTATAKKTAPKKIDQATSNKNVKANNHAQKVIKKSQNKSDQIKAISKKQDKATPKNKNNLMNNNFDNKCDQQIFLRTTERATIVIPINYQELEKKAKVTVRSAIDYMVDMCLLLLAFWVYFFKDERLAIPFLILIIYRQLQETIMLNIPTWINTHTPTWLKKKSS